jgi:hypothetical protein
MKPKLTFLLALTFLFLFCGFVYGQEAVNSLYCTGSRSSKHYDSKTDMTAIVNIDLEKKNIYLKYVDEILKNNTDSETFNKSFKRTTDKYAVIDEFDGHIIIEKTGQVNNNATVLNKNSSGKLYTVDIKEDDKALGRFDRFSGKLNIETKYYDSKDEKFEFGWAIDLVCEKKEKLF